MPDPLRFPVPAELQTERLLLRPFTVEDAPALHEALLESLDALRRHLWFIPWVAEEPTLESAQVRCRQAQAHLLTRTDLAYLAYERSTRRMVGSVGLHRTDWSTPKTEVGYWIRSTEVGKGYASEAVNALVNWALNELRAIRVELLTDEENMGSRKVAERCGFTLEGIHRHTGLRPDGSLRNLCVYAKLRGLD